VDAVTALLTRMDAALETYVGELTSTQKGAIGEAIIGAQLMLASNGRLSPFRSIADDDGTDLLIADKHTGRISMIQVKCRFRARAEPSRYEQFDVRIKTFREVAHNWVLAALIDPTDGALRCSWMFPSVALAGVAVRKQDKLVIKPNPSSGSTDRYVPWRCETAVVLAARIMATDLGL
jgi:hypothetical protein